MEMEIDNGLGDLFSAAANSGRLFASVTAMKADKPVSDTEQSIYDFMASLGMEVDPAIAKPRVYRYYNLVAVSKSDGSRIIENNLLATVAGRRRALLRRDGYRVSLIEVNCSQEIEERVPVDRNKFQTPDPMGGRGIPNVIPYTSPRIRARKSNKIETLRQKMVAAENNRLRKLAERRQNDRCFVHSNRTGEMQFAGTFEELAAYIQSLIDNETLNLEMITITMPGKKNA